MPTTPDRIFALHVKIIAGLGLAYIAFYVAHLYHFDFPVLRRQFSLSSEHNVPSAFSALALAVVALTAASNARALPAGRSERGGWIIFAGVFVFLACDEFLMIHEHLNRIKITLGPLGRVGPIGVFPYAIVALVLGLYLMPFWLRQSRPVRLGIALSGICYVMAAIGFEIVEIICYRHHVGQDSLKLIASFCAEELGEMLAVAIFLRAFLTRLAELEGSLIGFSFKPAAKTMMEPCEP